MKYPLVLISGKKEDFVTFLCLKYRKKATIDLQIPLSKDQDRLYRKVSQCPGGCFSPE